MIRSSHDFLHVNPVYFMEKMLQVQLCPDLYSMQVGRSGARFSTITVRKGDEMWFCDWLSWSNVEPVKKTECRGGMGRCVTLVGSGAAPLCCRNPAASSAWGTGQVIPLRVRLWCIFGTSHDPVGGNTPGKGMSAEPAVPRAGPSSSCPIPHHWAQRWALLLGCLRAGEVHLRNTTLCDFFLFLVSVIL